jgi:putative ABC transport system ATP-binding protein
LIQLEGIVKRYGEAIVLRGLSLSVKRGELVSIMGASGSGKSTLLNIIGGMDRPDEGTILIDGVNIASYTDDELTRYRRVRVGFVFQFFNLLPNITVFENIEMPLLLNGIADNGRVAAYIREVGLSGKERSYPHQLSGGEQQRVAIARALIHDPDVILADEPTGSLDSQTGSTIMELIVGLATSACKTVLLVTHEPTIAQYGRRVLRIKDGVIA